MHDAAGVRLCERGCGLGGGYSGVARGGARGGVLQARAVFFFPVCLHEVECVFVGFCGDMLF